jgi:nucleoside-diphosphate-sugar epimerase
MRVLLTGATGFIGSHLARLLVAEGHTVAAVVRRQSSRWRIHDVEPRLDIIWGDTYHVNGLRAELDRARADVCVHMAWDSVSGWSSPNAVDSAAGSLMLLRAVLESGCKRLVVAGSSFEYEATDDPLTEESPIRPQDLYGAAKHAVHLVAEQVARMNDASLAWLRIFNTYGTYDDERRLVPSIVRALLRDECVATTAGEQIRDYTHVEDVASAILKVAESRYNGPINIASGVAVSVRDVAVTTARLLGKAEKLRLGVLPYPPGEPMMNRADVRRLREEIGWVPRHDLGSGLAHTVNWLTERYRQRA